MKKVNYRTVLVISLGILGYLLFTLPGRFFEQYDTARAHGQAWGYVYIGAVALGILLLLSASAWIFYIIFSNTRKGRKKREQSSAPAREIPEKEKIQLISRNIREAKKAAEGAEKGSDFEEAIEEGSRRIEYKLDTEVVEIAAFGIISSGKSTLLNALAGKRIFDTNVAGGTTKLVRQIDFPGGDRVTLVDTPGLAETGGEEREDMARHAAATADLILFVIDGALKEFEYRAISRLHDMEKRVLVCLNKLDWFSPQDQQALLSKLRSQLSGIVEPECVVAVQAAEVTRTIIRIDAEGRERKETRRIPPDISMLAEKMSSVIKRERRQLILCNLLLQSRMLKRDVEERIRKGLVVRAGKIVDSYTWKAALAAAASPTPILDVAAGLGFSLKMILEIASVFERKVELSDARELLNQLLKNLYASLGASALAPAVAQVVASGLKSVPMAGTLSGGALQGVVQAVVTRWTGMVMIEYFQGEREAEVALNLQEMAMEKWKALTSPSQLASLAVEGLGRLEKAGGGKRGETS